MTLKVYCKEFKYICKTDYYHNFSPVGGNTKGGQLILKGNTEAGQLILKGNTKGFLALKQVDKNLIGASLYFERRPPFPFPPRGKSLTN